ncbi:MAG: hypothetical protein ACK4P3_04310 [Fimbriimonadaceae bacterium]
MKYRTGRERKLVYSGTISGSILMTWKVGIPASPPPAGSLPDQRGFGFSLQAFTFPMPVPEVAFQAFSPVAPGFVGLPLPAYEVGWEIMASDGMGGFDAGGIVVPISPSESGTWSWEQTLSGSWSISLDVEEWFEPYFWTGDTDPDGFPSHGGAPQKDGLRAGGVRYFERMRVGGKITASLTVNGVSVNAESVMGEDDLFDVSSYDLSGAVLAAAAHGQSATSLVTVDFQSLPLSAPVSHEEDWGMISLAPGFLAKAFAPEETDVSSAVALGVLCPPDSYELHASLRAFDSPYPDAGEVAWTPKLEFDPALPGWVRAVSAIECSPETRVGTLQQRYVLFGFLNGAEYAPVGADEKCPIRVWLPADWLYESGEDERDWRCSLLGRRYGLGELRHEPETVLEPDDWTLEGGTWFSETPVEVLAGGEGAELVALFDHRLDSESYRYLQVQVFGVEEPCTVSVLLGDKEYRLRLQGGEERKLIDLLDPHVPTDAVDPQHTRWPLGSGGEPAPDGPLWGVSRIESVRFVLPPGCRFGILGLSLVRQSEARFMALAPFLGWHDYSGGQEAIRLGHGLVDGRQCNEVPYIFREPYSYGSIDSFLDFADGSTGWSVLGSPPFPDEFHTAERPALWLMGAGALHDGEEFLYTSSLPANELTLEAQALWDEIATYPLCGNPFDGSEHPVGLSGSATPVAVCKHLRGCAEGVALRAPLPIRLLETATEAERGEAFAGALGLYRTGLPFGFGSVSHQLLCGEIAHLWEADEWHSRGFHRLSFRMDDPLLAPAYAVGPDLRHALAWCADGELILALSANSSPSLIGAAKVDLAANEVGLAFSAGKSVRLLCLVAFEGEIGLSSIGEPDLEVSFLMSFGSGSSPCLEVSAEGLIWVYFVRFGQVFGALLDGRFEEIRAPAPVLGVPEADAVASRQFVGAGGQWKMGLLVAGPSGVSWFWSLDGINFSA